MTRAIRVLALLLAVLMAGCLADLDYDDGEHFATESQTIINGDPPDHAIHDAVVGLWVSRNGTTYLCSGTLISPDVVVTAAHCLDEAHGGKTVDPVEASQVSVRAGDNANSLPSFTVAEVFLHPDYDRRKLRHDIALLQLNDSVGVAPVAGLPASLGFSPADIGVTMNFAGYGRTETGQRGQKYQIDLPLGGLGCSVSGCPGSDDPATQISYVQPTGGPCSGDSGGPAFIQRGGTWYVGGITSNGDNGCESWGVSTRVDAYEAWIAGLVDTTVCGDGTCDASESSATCPGDCGVVCGDGVCNGAEACDSCAADCGACPSCGDGTCDVGESCGDCAVDCGACPYCGDGLCNAGESCGDCVSDCGDCPVCAGVGDACGSNSDCCSNKCRGRNASRTCR